MPTFEIPKMRVKVMSSRSNDLEGAQGWNSCIDIALVFDERSSGRRRLCIALFASLYSIFRSTVCDSGGHHTCHVTSIWCSKLDSVSISGLLVLRRLNISNSTMSTTASYMPSMLHHVVPAQIMLLPEQVVGMLTPGYLSQSM